jgi:hypothetical protein
VTVTQPQPQPLDLDHAEALANAATPGPWFNDSHEIYAGPHTDIPAMNEWIGETCDPSRPDHGAANAALAAWARDGVPALVAEIRRLRAELAQARQQAAAVLALPVATSAELRLMDGERYHHALGYAQALAEVRRLLATAPASSGA